MLSNEVKSEITKQFAKHGTDTGSCEVQIALISKRIQEISEHLKKFKKDKHSRLGLVKLVGKRRSFLKYIKGNDLEGYEKLVGFLKENKYI
jgi:small subunit ribosomal protein S15